LDFEFVGTTSARLSIDSKEFEGCSIVRITEDIQKVLREMAPDVSFFIDDIVLAAEAVANASASGT
jgi:hypothetical protein